MLKSSARSAIRLKGVRHNNLKNFDLDLPLKQLIVITGLSGSGKSSLAFDTLFAEGQRRYIETFSPYARQFFDRMDKPKVDSIEGIPPAIAIEQRNAVRTTRSTVGTMTEICDYMKVLWPHIAHLHCRQCGKPVRKDSPQHIWTNMQELVAGSSTAADQRPTVSEPDLLITFDLPLTEKLSLSDCLVLIAKQGYQRLWLNREVIRLEEVISRVSQSPRRLACLTVVQDRVKLSASNRARFVEACEQAYHFGKGKVTVYPLEHAGRTHSSPLRFSNRLHCANCDLEYREPTPALFSFNHPVGACPACRGFGRVISIDYRLALPDRTRTLAQGVVKPWQTGLGAECQRDLLRMCRHFEIPTDVPFEQLPKKWQDFVIDGEPDYGKDEEHEWPRAWYGIKGYFRWLESKAYKMHVRVLLSRYRAYTQCPNCRGQRFQHEALLYKLKCEWTRSNANAEAEDAREYSPGTGRLVSFSAATGLNLAEFYALPIRDALQTAKELSCRVAGNRNDPLRLALEEVRSRLAFLEEVGLGYLTLDRPTRSLSGGETERVNLTTCLGSRLVNALFVLDEPSVGLHPRDTDRLVRILQRLRDAGNTVVVVEHEASVMRAADQIIDLGPGHGSTGGEVVFQGSFRDILRSGKSLTGKYLSGRVAIALPQLRPVSSPGGSAAASNQLVGSPPATRHRAIRETVLHDAQIPYTTAEHRAPVLRLTRATRHNLKSLSAEIPLGRFVCITGVSGSGKTTLVREVLLPLVAEQLKKNLPPSKASERIPPDENETEVTAGDNGGTPGAVLEGTEHLGNVVLVDQSILGKTPRSNPAVYTGAFDSLRELFAQSELARQRGLNASAFSFNSNQGQCQRCRGAGFEKIEMQFLSDVFIRCPDCDGRRYRDHILEIKIRSAAPGSPAHALSIADLLDSTVEDALLFISGFPESRHAQRAAASLQYLMDVGLGYLKLGQPINTLSGGESQRLKLVRHLVDAELEDRGTGSRGDGGQPPLPTLFLFDEPTTGLHFEDVRILLRVFQRLVDRGHSVLVIEHNLDVIKCADWVIDLGPEAGDEGGQLVVAGTPAEVAVCDPSHTGRALRKVIFGGGRKQSNFPGGSLRTIEEDRHVA